MRPRAAAITALLRYGAGRVAALFSSSAFDLRPTSARWWCCDAVADRRHPRVRQAVSRWRSSSASRCSRSGCSGSARWRISSPHGRRRVLDRRPDLIATTQLDELFGMSIRAARPEDLAI
jgi:hypothetical protein